MQRRPVILGKYESIDIFHNEIGGYTDYIHGVYELGILGDQRSHQTDLACPMVITSSDASLWEERTVEGS